MIVVPSLADEEKTASEWGTVTGQAWLYYFTQRNKTTGQQFDSIKESFAIGGWLKYETPWLADHVGADESMGGRDGYQVRLRLQYNFQLL